VTHAQINSPIEDVAMAVIAAMAVAEAVEELAVVPYQAIKALPRML
jgi:hypothetical protein